MLAISNDFYSYSAPTLACCSYTDVSKKIASLVQISGINFQVKQDLVWLVDQIRMRYRMEPVGITGGADQPVIVVGTGYVPQALVWYGSRTTTKGSTLYQYNVRSLHIQVVKGDSFIMRSNDAKVLARRFGPETFRLVPDMSLIVDLLGIGKYRNAISDGEINLGGQKDFTPYIEDHVRREIFDYFKNKSLGNLDIVTPGIEKWFGEKSSLVISNQRFLDRQKYIEDRYRKSSVVICQLPMYAEYKRFFQEFEWQNDMFVPIGERVFFQGMEDLTERYPHIVGVHNILRAKSNHLFSHKGNYTVYEKDMNFFRCASGSEIFNASVPSVMFPSQRVPSEDEVRRLTSQSVPAPVPPAEESAVSVLNF